MNPDTVSLADLELAIRAIARRCVMRDGTTADETLLVLNKREVEMLRRAAKLILLVQSNPAFASVKGKK